MSTLPTPHSLLTSILAAIPTPQTESHASNPLKDAPSTAKPLLLALHVLYPNELLPALDLLDRHLLTRFTIQPDILPEAPLERPSHSETDPSSASPNLTQQALPSTQKAPPTYFVRSAQQPRTNVSSSTRYHDPLATHYEVRPLAWNCSCPAFAFAAFSAIGSTATSDAGQDSTALLATTEWQFGGLSRGASLAPVCKHLLACVLVERCPIFQDCVEEKSVSVEELAGWCAGWGG